jgi:hypothetical protein
MKNDEAEGPLYFILGGFFRDGVALSLLLQQYVANQGTKLTAVVCSSSQSRVRILVRDSMVEEGKKSALSFVGFVGVVRQGQLEQFSNIDLLTDVAQVHRSASEGLKSGILEG